MIVISKRYVIIIFIIIGLSVLLYMVFQQPSKTSTVDSDELMEQEEVETVETEEVEEEEATEVTVQENPIREFFSDQIKKATELFFTRDLHIVTLGDSLTEGVGDELNEGGYVGIIEENLDENQYDIDIQNFGKRGRRTTHLLDVLEKEEVITAVEEADIVLITIGANDIMQVFKENFTKLTLEVFNKEQIAYEKRLHEIFTKIRIINEDADIYLIGFYNPFQQYFSYIEELDVIVDNWNKVGRQVASQYENADYIPIKDLFENHSMELFAEDHFHPNHLGYKLIANRVLQYIVNEGENYGEAESAIE